MILGLAAGVIPHAKADTMELSVAVPSFIIPLNGQSGTLTVFSDGSSPLWGGDINVLGSQTFTLGGNSSSSGDLLLNLHFSGDPLGNPAYTIEDANLSLKVDDLDFSPDYVTSSIVLQEMAILNGVNGSLLSTPIDLADYLPAGTTTTDDVTIGLDPIPLFPLLSASDFTDPFILSLRLSAVVTNSGSRSVTLLNTPEGLVSDLSLTLTPRTSVPESGGLFLFVAGLASLFLLRRYRR